MMIIGLPLNADLGMYDHIPDGAGEPGVQGPCTAADLPPQDCVAVVPGQRLSWHAVRLPNLPKAQQRQAIIGLLEDQWLQAPDDLHISVHPKTYATPDGPNHWVCVCDRAWLSQVLQPLVAHGRVPQRLIPEFAPALPHQPESLVFSGSPNQVQAFWVRHQGVLMAPSPPPWPLHLAKPEVVCAEPAVLDAIPPWASTQAQTITRAERWRAAANLSWDLAQGPWAQNPGQKFKRMGLAAGQAFFKQARWKPVRWSLLAVIGVQALGLLGWTWLVGQTEQAQRRELGLLLTATFPNTSYVVDAPRQMQQAMRQLRQQVGADDHGQLETMLGLLRATVSASEGVQSIQYDGVSLKVRGVNVDALSADERKRWSDWGYTWQSDPQGLVLRWERAP